MFFPGVFFSVPFQVTVIWLLSIVAGWLVINSLIRILIWHFLIKIHGQGTPLLPKYQWWLPRIVGTIEQSIATASILTGRVDAIAIWLVMKTTGAWSTQHKDAHPSALTADYSIFLIGTALSVGLGVGTAYIIQHCLPFF